MFPENNCFHRSSHCPGRWLMPRPWDTHPFSSVDVPLKLLQMDEFSGKYYKPTEPQEEGSLVLLTSLIFWVETLCCRALNSWCEVAFPDIVFLFRSNYKPVQVLCHSLPWDLDIFSSKYTEANDSELPRVNLPKGQWQLKFSDFNRKKRDKILPLGSWIRQISLPGDHMLNSHPHGDSLC